MLRLTELSRRAFALGLALLVVVPGVHAQAPVAQPPAAPAPARDPDRRLNVSQPDFTLAALPTNLRVARGKFAFRVTHRFARPLGEGDVGNLLEDFFGFDSGAQIGLELRYGLLPGLQVGVHRTSDRTIQLFTQYALTRQETFPLGLSLWASADGTNNFRDSRTPAIGVVVSRELGDRGAVYVEPMWVNNTNPLPSALADDNNTFMIGIGSRLRLTRAVYLTAEVSPRISGHAPGDALLSVGVERRAGGHLFSINVSNGFGTTLGQVARGGTSFDDWYIGFNISRKFY